MAETAVNSVIQHLGPLLVTEVQLLRGVHKEIVSFKAELERIQTFLNNAEAIAETGDEGVQIWVKQVTVVAYRIKDVVDEHILILAKQPQRFGFFISFFRKVTRWITVLKQRHKIASQIIDIKTTICEINEVANQYGFSSTTNPPRIASLVIGDDEVVGIEYPKYELISRLVGQDQSQRAVISVVGMGGIGKTTLVKEVCKSHEVDAHFDCQAWITVSKQYKPEELLKTMIYVLSGIDVPPDEGIESLIDKLRGYLYEKRYIIVFDDVWDFDVWVSMRRALPNNSKGSKVIITTRNEQVAAFCKETSMDHVYLLQPLTDGNAWKLFCKKAFRGGYCPPELVNVSLAIVRKCEGLPLAVVVIAGVLSTKKMVISEWEKLYESLNSSWEPNPSSFKKFLLLSYKDLPLYLKPCLLYFGILPKNYSIRGGRLIRLWIAEGFIEEHRGKTLEEVAEEYLSELIQRSLVVEVSKSKLYRRVVIEYQVHDVLKDYRILNSLVHEIILSISDDCSFCQLLTEENSSFNDKTRRLSMHMHYCSLKKVMESISKSSVQSFFLFEVGKLPKKPLLGTLAKNFKLLNVLDLQGAPLDKLHEEVGNLYYLRYLSVRRTGVQKIPKSIGNLLNLLTLDLKYSPVSELPIEINSLHKLRHLLAYYHNYGCAHIVDIIRGVRIQGGIGCLEELQKLWHVETNHDDGLSLIEELEKLRQLRKLGITKLKREHGRALCVTIEKMKFLNYLKVAALSDDEILDLQYVSSPPQYLQRLDLGGHLEKLPDWIPKLQNLVKLSLLHSGLTNDPLKALQVLPSLEHLHLWYAYDGEQLYFEVGSFQKLKQLDLLELKGLDSVIIEEGALPLLEELRIGPIPQLKEVPPGIHYLTKLKTLAFIDMPKEFLDRMQPQPSQGKDYWIIEHIPDVLFWSRWGFSGYWNNGTLKKYFKWKVKNQRVTEAE